MDSKEKQQLVLERITGVLWFFLCLFCALAAIGVYFLLAQISNYELYMQLGFTGGAAAMVVMGALNLAQAFMMKEKPMIQRLSKASGVLLGAFGALLMLGIFFEMLRYPNAWSFLQIGLLGGAAALALTGSLKLGKVNAKDPLDDDSRGGQARERATSA